MSRNESSTFAEDRVAIVSGTSAGLGEAVARQLLEHGWSVIGIARRAAVITNERYQHIACDLATVATDETDLARQLSAAQQRLGGRRIGLVNNAAAPDGLMPLDRLDPRVVARVYAVNVIAPIWLMGYVMRTTPPNVAIRIVNVSSGAATTGFPGLAAYGGSKAALRLAGMSLAREWEDGATHASRRDAAVLSYEPGVVDTDMQRYARSRPRDEFPWVQIFLDFQARGIAVPAERPAADVVAFLESTSPPAFSEQRLRT